MHGLLSKAKTTLILQVIVFGLWFAPIKSSAQRIIDNHQHVWLDLSVDQEINEKISLSGLVSLRRNDFVANWQQSLLRINLNRTMTNNFTATLGYDLAINFPYGAQPIDKRFNEHRIVEQFTLKNEVASWKITHRYRVEQRFLMLDETTIRNRFRYKLGVKYPIVVNGEKTSWSFKMFNELFIHLRKTEPAHYFDQNWAYGGFDYTINPHMSVSLGYMNQYLTKPDGVRTENNHTILLGIKRK